MIRGLDHFKQTFADLSDHYVVVGGIAATLLLDSAGLKFRATKDIDLVIVSANIEGFSGRLLEYIRSGQYEIQQRCDGKNTYYRFKEPSYDEYPYQIEVFHKLPDGITLFEGQHLVPLKDDADGIGLSAILLEEEYFKFVKDNVEMKDGVPVTNTSATMVLKTRAYNDLVDRKAAGDEVDSKEIKKHRNDVFRLSQALDDGTAFKLSGLPAEHFARFIKDVGNIPKGELNQILKSLGTRFTKESWLGLINTAFEY